MLKVDQAVAALPAAVAAAWSEHVADGALPAAVQEREGGDVRAMQAGKRAREGSGKVKADKGGRQRVEAKLDVSKHRRMSRTKAKQAMTDMSWED